MAVAPFEPAEVKIVDRQDDAVVVVFQSAEGGEFPMKFQRAQLAGLVSQFEKEVGRNQPGPPPEQKDRGARSKCSHRRLAGAEEARWRASPDFQSRDARSGANYDSSMHPSS